MAAGAIVGVAAAVVAIGAIGTRAASMRRQGYPVGGHVIVRCSAGHLFTTLWLPGASLKAVKLGPMRLQHCPVGHHFAVVRPVRESDLTEQELTFAREHRDGNVP